ncbi:molybdenum cofactor guanylyltransferase [Microbacterium terricola]|uniref:MobA-like NTP transferase domain-containing protein n=1 Tax=Microbacterium terricola TaxID=344163 RepID=A0ABM8E115_9MICO|nr:NTP transferase domain-containing protein [Microbacterium terricola]UYK40781.1 NTP transferase domain-containing protein [Microbacterium terricola]BDV31476.1 hypothetical protein Microterr_21360 [Microbacterium terricola]
MTAANPSRYGAVLLAGGRATRMGGAPKPFLDIAGRSMLHRAIDAVSLAGAQPLTIVGEEPASFDSGGAAVEWVREHPPFSGPAAAIVAALRHWRSPAGQSPPARGDAAATDVALPLWTFVLACDLPRVDLAVRQLRDDSMLLPSDTEGICFADASGRPQWLTGMYRTDALWRSASALPDGGRDAPVRTLLDDLAIAVVRDERGAAQDVDTWEDLNRARGAAAASSEEQR